MKSDKNMKFLSIYKSSVFQDFESLLRAEVNLVGDVIRLVLDDYISSFNTYELESDIYIFKDIPKALLSFLQS